MLKIILKSLILITIIITIIVVSIFTWYKLWTHQDKIIIPDLASQNAKAFFEWAKKQIWVVTKYDYSNWYYSNGWYPPEDTGVCSDIIWRTYQNLWYDFKEQFGTDRSKNPNWYDLKADSNIHYRRVKELYTYFSKNGKTLSKEMIPWDIWNLSNWQTGDIVTFSEYSDKHLWHIGIISNIRRNDGVPYMIDNHGKWVNITITPLDWPSKINGHFRIF
jgi:uncharacterized protein YijF (DUF1287 family)